MVCPGELWCKVYHSTGEQSVNKQMYSNHSTGEQSELCSRVTKVGQGWPGSALVRYITPPISWIWLLWSPAAKVNQGQPWLTFVTLDQGSTLASLGLLWSPATKVTKSRNVGGDISHQG